MEWSRRHVAHPGYDSWRRAKLYKDWGHTVRMIDASEALGNARLARNGQRVQDHVGRAAHGHIQSDGIVKRLERSDVAGF